MSLIQFSFSLAATKKRDLRLFGFRKYIDLILSTEAWSLLLVLITQDLPCFLIRVTILKTVYDSNEDVYILSFFTLKNGFMIYLEIYRSYLIVREQIKSENTNVNTLSS